MYQMKIKRWLNKVHIQSHNLYVDGEIASEYDAVIREKDIDYVIIQDDGVVSIHTKGGN